MKRYEYNRVARKALKKRNAIKNAKRSEIMGKIVSRLWTERRPSEVHELSQPEPQLHLGLLELMWPLFGAIDV